MSIVMRSGAMAIRQDSVLEPFVLRDCVIETWAPADCGLEIIYPFAESVVGPTVVLDNVTIRGPFTTGLRLRNCWNAKLRDVTVTGVTTEQTHAQLEAATMQVAMDLGGSMDVHITNPMITCARTGILVEDTIEGGQGEGLHVSGGFIMHTVDGIRLKGFGSGGWPTPNGFIRDVHLVPTRHGVFATRWTGLHVTDCDVYVVQPDAQAWGVFLADGCSEAHGLNNRFWNTQPGAFLGGYVLDASHDIDLRGRLGRTLSIGLYVTPSCTGISDGLVQPAAYVPPVYNLSAA